MGNSRGVPLECCMPIPRYEPLTSMASERDVAARQVWSCRTRTTKFRTLGMGAAHKKRLAPPWCVLGIGLAHCGNVCRIRFPREGPHRPWRGVPPPTVVFAASRRTAVGSPVRVRERYRWHFYAIGLPYRCAGDDNSYPGKGERQDTLSAMASHPLNGSGPAEGQGNRGGGPLEL